MAVALALPVTLAPSALAPDADADADADVGVVDAAAEAEAEPEAEMEAEADALPVTDAPAADVGAAAPVAECASDLAIDESPMMVKAAGGTDAAEVVAVPVAVA